jgi:S1-C subfamily serine protease
VESLSEASVQRIRPGDVILSVQGKEITSTSQLRDALGEEALQKNVRLRILSEIGPRTILLTAADR